MSDVQVSPADQSGMVLPFTPLNLSFHHLSYYVPLSKEVAEAEGKKDNNRIGSHDGKDMLQLLRDCSGSFRPAILTALVGSSGAGKARPRRPPHPSRASLAVLTSPFAAQPPLPTRTAASVDSVRIRL